MFPTPYECATCAAQHPVRADRWRCDCGSPLRLPSVLPARSPSSARVARDATGARSIGRSSLWRFRERFSIASTVRGVTLGEGTTPLLPFEICGRTVWILQDQLQPSGSYKDRGSALLISVAQALGVRGVVEDSSGNAGASIAMYAAAAGISATIFAPDSTSPSKLRQIERCGAKIVRVPGPREKTAAAARLAAESTFYASHVWNPFFLQGLKSVAYDVVEQLGRAPDYFVVPVGNGSLLLGAALGFEELLAAGITRRAPAQIGVQPETCAPLAVAGNRGEREPVEITPRPTLAEGIAIASPPRGKQILAAVEATGGAWLTVSEQELRDGLDWLHAAGRYVEPTSAAVIAAMRRWLPSAPEGAIVASIYTGHGLKYS